jgi:hypothetical protein
MLSNEELFVVLRRPINFDRDQKAAAIDCLATSAIRRSDIIKGILQEDKNTVYQLWERGERKIRMSGRQKLINSTVKPWIASNLVCECFARRAKNFNLIYERGLAIRAIRVVRIRCFVFVCRASRDHYWVDGSSLTCSVSVSVPHLYSQHPCERILFTIVL